MKFYNLSCDFFIAGFIPSFNLYLFNTSNKERIVELHANSPVTDEHMDKWSKAQEAGSFLQVYHEELDKFYDECGLSYDDLIEFNQVQFALSDLYSQRMSKFSPIVDDKFNLKSELIAIYKTQNYANLIAQARAQILCFPLNISSQVTLATLLADTVLLRDNNVNRQVAFAFFFAKKQGYKDIEDLADIVLGVFLKDIGSGLVKPSSINNYLNRESELDVDEWFSKHPMFSIFIAAKAKIELSKRLKRIILEHHERADGQGFPRRKDADQLSPLSILVLTVEHLFDKLGKDGDIFKAMNKIALSSLPDYSGISSESLKSTLGSLISSEEEIENFQKVL